jgi:protein SCO1
MTKVTIRRLSLLAAFAVLALALAGWWVERILGSRGLAPDFSLTDQDDRPFRLSDERGHPVAIFFGYSRCPDECPATLARLAAARRQMGPQGDGIRVLFITVDPRYDTAARLKSYLARFDPTFIGLTGSEAQLAPVYRAYHVWYQALPKTKGGLEDLEAHTATVWILNSSGRPKGFADWSDSTAALARDLREAS